MRNKKKEIQDLQNALLDVGIEAAVLKRKLEKLQKEHTCLEAVLDVTTEKYFAVVEELSAVKSELASLKNEQI